MPKKKAEYLAQNFDKIVKMGGLSAGKERLERAPGRQGKMEFLETFVGIGEKYARDTMMDVYHPDFRDSVAMDTVFGRLREADGKLTWTPL